MKFAFYQKKKIYRWLKLIFSNKLLKLMTTINTVKFIHEKFTQVMYVVMWNVSTLSRIKFPESSSFSQTLSVMRGWFPKENLLVCTAPALRQ